MNISSFLTESLVAAAIGGIVGGSMTLAAQMLALSYQSRETQRRADALDASTAFTLWIKMNQILSNLHHFNSHVREAKSVQDSLGGNTLLFSALRPIANDLGRVYILPDEKALMLRWHSIDLLNKMMSVDWTYNSLLSALETYGQMRSDLLSSLTPTSMEGIIGHVEMTAKEFSVYQPRAAALENLAQQIITDYADDFDKCLEIMRLLSDEIKRRTGQPLDFEIKEATKRA